MSNTNGVTTRPTTTDAVYSVAVKIAKTIIEAPLVNPHYADFDKDELQFGSILEDLRIALKTPAAFNPNETTFMPPKYDTVIKRYFGEWEDKRIDTEVSRKKIREFMLNDAGVTEFISKVVNNLDASELHAANQKYKDFFLTLQSTATAINDRLLTMYANNTAAGGHKSTVDALINASCYLKSGSCYEVLDVSATTDEVLTEIRNVVDDMLFENATYNGISGYVSGARMEDLRIIANNKFLNDIDVTKLANLFNMEKASMLAKIVKTDGCEFTYADATATTGTISAAHGYVVIICDKNAIGRVTKGREFEEDFVKERFSRWYGSTYDEMFYYNPALKAYAIVIPDTVTVA